MIHHPIVLGGKLALLLVILIVLTVLHGILTPDQFRVAVYIAGGCFLIGCVALWVFAIKVLCNPNSRLGKQFILSHEDRTDGGCISSKNEFQDMIGHRGNTLSPLRPSGIGQFGDKRVSVVTEGEFIVKGAQVEIVSAQGSRVVVRAAPSPESKT
jgi:membrane-bound ClpP family serine protease